MNIIALMPATKAYEVLLKNLGGYSGSTCCVWQEDSQHNFITFIPPDVHDHWDYYCFGCANFNGMVGHGVDLRNGILTYHTIDNTTTYWVDLSYDYPGGHIGIYRGGYNRDTCFYVLGSGDNIAELNEQPYDECQKIRGS